MGTQIIEQPDGRLAVFSTITDSFEMQDATNEEVIDYFVQQAAEETRERVTAMVAKVRDPEKRPYHQFGLPYERAVEMHNETLKAEQDPDAGLSPLLA